MVSFLIFNWYALLLIGLPEYITEVTSIITRTLVAKIKFSTVHSIENALAERTSAKYSIIIMSYRVPSTVIVIVNNYLPLP
jgi:hypothetical protein